MFSCHSNLRHGRIRATIEETITGTMLITDHRGHQIIHHAVLTPSLQVRIYGSTAELLHAR